MPNTRDEQWGKLIEHLRNRTGNRYLLLDEAADALTEAREMMQRVAELERERQGVQDTILKMDQNSGSSRYWANELRRMHREPPKSYDSPERQPNESKLRAALNDSLRYYEQRGAAGGWIIARLREILADNPPDPELAIDPIEVITSPDGKIAGVRHRISQGPQYEWLHWTQYVGTADADAPKPIDSQVVERLHKEYLTNKKHNDANCLVWTSDVAALLAHLSPAPQEEKAAPRCGLHHHYTPCPKCSKHDCDGDVCCIDAPPAQPQAEMREKEFEAAREQLWTLLPESVVHAMIRLIDARAAAQIGRK